jgi:general secretion pathway protein I
MARSVFRKLFPRSSRSAEHGFTSSPRSAEHGCTSSPRSAEHGFTSSSRSAEHGFTLIEMLVALAIFSLAALALLRLEGATLFSTQRVADTTVAQIVADLKAGTTTLEREIPSLARKDRAYDIATIVAGLAGIDHATAMKALTGPNDEPLIVLFRSLDTPWAVFELILQLRAKRLRQNYVRSQTMARTYQEMEMATAQRVLRFLQVRRAAEGGGRAA